MRVLYSPSYTCIQIRQVTVSPYKSQAIVILQAKHYKGERFIRTRREAVKLNTVKEVNRKETERQEVWDLLGWQRKQILRDKHSQAQQKKWNLKGEAKQSQSWRESRKQHTKGSGQQKMMCTAREKKGRRRLAALCLRRKGMKLAVFSETSRELEPHMQFRLTGVKKHI